MSRRYNGSKRCLSAHYVIGHYVVSLIHILALMGQKRLVIQNGGVHKVITTTAKEKENLAVLTKVDSRILALRESLRRGQTIDFEITGYFSEVLK